jgi:hypothetical protein
MDSSTQAFISLFKTAVQKCFGPVVNQPLSDVDCKLLSHKVLEETGLVIGPKSIRNYSIFVSGGEGRKENPSVATLDTLARYVLNAPRTDEATRKEKEGHYPYWYEYKSKLVSPEPPQKRDRKKILKPLLLALALILALAAVFGLLKGIRESDNPVTVSETFEYRSLDTLETNWTIVGKEESRWIQSLKRQGYVTLFTLPGDNWNDTLKIRNVLSRELSMNCFTTEIHIDSFRPTENWQQGGILLSETPDFKGKTLRLSVSYNDYFGGYQKAPEIIIQAVSSSESADKSKPEEVAHLTMFVLEKGHEEIVYKNLKRIALKIEKREKRIRFLFATGEMENFAFKEVASGEFNIQPKYLGIFASQGLSDNSVIPFFIDSFSMAGIDCGEGLSQSTIDP